MDLRNLPEDLSSAERPEARRKCIEEELDVDLSLLKVNPQTIGKAEEKNCEQMFGQVPIPVGLAGPLKVTFSSGESSDVYLPLATTEGALIASVNRGCKALTQSGNVKIESTYHGITRSIAFKTDQNAELVCAKIESSQDEWKKAGEDTSSHLKILNYDLDHDGEYIFLTIYGDTNEAMGMNMITVAAQAIGTLLSNNLNIEFVTVAGNVDSDKKPSLRTHDHGRGYEVTASSHISADVIEDILKSNPQSMLKVATAKLEHGSQIAGAVGSNLHASNIIAALYLATGQDAAHVVEGSLADTTVELVTSPSPNQGEGVRGRGSIKISTRLPSLLVGVRGGGTDLPAQSQALGLLLKPETSLHPCRQLAESIGAATLAGELSLLAAQATHTLASSHTTLAR